MVAGGRKLFADLTEWDARVRASYFYTGASFRIATKGLSGVKSVYRVLDPTRSFAFVKQICQGLSTLVCSVRFCICNPRRAARRIY